MPGHKRNSEVMNMVDPYTIDITEIEGFDNLHQPQGMIKQLAKRIAALYGAEKSFPIINGSSAGILAGISAATNYGDKVLVARNCHKSVYHGIALRGLTPIYYYPPLVTNVKVSGSVVINEIEEILMEHKDISLVIITSPTYEGIVSDIKKLSKVVHEYGALLLVDEAHGAHFGFHEGFPKSAVSLGADLVVQSLHKTLPSFTQTAVLHSNVAAYHGKIQYYLSVYQSSSPSYLLMGGIDQCISLLERQRVERFQAYDLILKSFIHQMKGLKKLHIINKEIIDHNESYDFDPSKIIISVEDTELTGHQLQRILYEEYHIVMEMETPRYVLGMTSICDSLEGFERLSHALIEIDSRLSCFTESKTMDCNLENRAEIAVPLSKAVEMPMERIPLGDSNHRVSGAYVCMYPPGSPILVPGERIKEDIIQQILMILKNNISITGLGEENKIDVLYEDRE